MRHRLAQCLNVADEKIDLIDLGQASLTMKAVAVSADDAFLSLRQLGKLGNAPIEEWNAIIGLRNRIVHDYMNIDMARLLDIVRDQRYRIVTAFLMRPLCIEFARPQQ